MATDLVDLLLRMGLASAQAILAVLALRRPLRAAFGAAVAYQAWLLLPVTLLAAALPAWRVPGVDLAPVMPAAGLPAMAAGVVRDMGADWSVPLLAAWLAGAVASLVLLALGHHRFVRSLGVLVERDGIHVAEYAGAPPSLLGWRAPRIVVPADFLTRYNEAERLLIIAHERRHALRGDPGANLAAAVLQCLLWFNPLVHLAMQRFRFDQELACDAAVMAAHPGQAKAYAQAMLKTQVTGAVSLASCHWQSSHPLKERIMQLTQSRPTTSRRAAGRLMLALLAMCCVGASVAARADTVPATASSFDVVVKLIMQDGSSSPPVPIRVKPGEPVKVGQVNGGTQWDGEFLFKDGDGGVVDIHAVIRRAGQTYSRPRLLVQSGETARLKVSDDAARSGFEVTIAATRVAP
jgi:bla regulator protein BlaR1